MTQKKRLALVAGETPHPRFLSLFEVLRSRFDVTLYTLGDEKFCSIYESGIRHKIFPAIPDMPGYMRDLEGDIASMDCVLGIETTRLSSFQAVRAARKSRIPVGVIVTETQPYFYDKFPNIRAIQYDICHSASFFWATSRAAHDTLLIEGVPASKIGVVRPVINTKKFFLGPHLRQKFRAYVGIRNEDLVLVCQTNLEPHYHLDYVLEALRHLRQQATPATLRLKILFVGDGSQARDLKFKASDLGLGAHVMFLHQDPEPFLCDLLNACDFYLVPGGVSPHKPAEYPLPLLEAMACGAVPIVPAGGVSAEICQDKGFTFATDQASSLVSCLYRALHSPETPHEMQIKMSDSIRHQWNSAQAQDDFVQDVWTMVSHAQQIGDKEMSPGETFRSIRSLIEKGRELDALIKIEEAELRGMDTSSCDAELACLKGEALYHLGRMNEAMEAYTKCMQMGGENAACLRGLGFIAWHGHSNEEALTFFKKALSLQENDLSSAYGIGLVYRRLGLLEEALFWLERCVLQDRAPSSAVIALAQTCAQLSPRSKGIATLERAIDTVGEQHALLATLGQMYLAEGYLEEAKQMLDKASQYSQSSVS